ncbi:hypothetical protein C8T65DRAFT_746887 [Cerioporus squamosus]|nr:hypothetical protein C8T65DRAFT_746887 [Cerioporus squamosus]
MHTARRASRARLVDGYRLPRPPLSRALQEHEEAQRGELPQLVALSSTCSRRATSPLPPRARRDATSDARRVGANRPVPTRTAWRASRARHAFLLISPRPQASLAPQSDERGREALGLASWPFPLAPSARALRHKSAKLERVATAVHHNRANAPGPQARPVVVAGTLESRAKAEDTRTHRPTTPGPQLRRQLVAASTESWEEVENRPRRRNCVVSDLLHLVLLLVRPPWPSAAQVRR